MTPDVRVVRGEPDDVELAALVAGLAAGTAHPPSTDHTQDPGPTSARRWRQAGGGVRHRPEPGPDSWRWSLHPRG